MRLPFALGYAVAAGGLACGDPEGAGGSQPATTVATSAVTHAVTSGDTSTTGSGGQGGQGGGDVGCDDGPEVHVLFIGNSHTYVNDVPALVRELACTAGTKVVSQMVADPGATLVDNAMNPAALAAIAAEPWDYVILQDQQQRPGFRLPDVDSISVPAAQSLVEAIRANDPATVPLYYMVWARQAGDAMNCAYYPLVCTYEGNTRAVAEGYSLYAERTSADVIPVALAWAAAVADPDAPLAPGELWSDGSHGTVTGSYFAASMIAARLTSRPAASFTYEAGIAPSVATYLRTTADEILAAHLANPRVETEETVRAACSSLASCAGWPDTAPVVFSLSSGPCAALFDGTAPIQARLRTTLDCEEGVCMTLPLRGWRDVVGGAIADGTYSVHAHFDSNENGAVDPGELEACADASFEVGSGIDLLLTAFAPNAT